MSERQQPRYRTAAQRDGGDVRSELDDGAPDDVESATRIEGAFLAGVLLVPVIAGLWAAGRVGVAETVCLLGAIVFLVDTCRSAWRRSRRF